MAAQLASVMLHMAEVVEVDFCACELAPGEPRGAAQRYFALARHGHVEFLMTDCEVFERRFPAKSRANQRLTFIAAEMMQVAQFEDLFTCCQIEIDKEERVIGGLP